MSTRISGLLLLVWNYHASVKMANRADPFAVAVVRGEDVVALSMPGQIDCLSSNRHPEVANIDTMPSVLLSTSNCSVLLVLKSKF